MLSGFASYQISTQRKDAPGKQNQYLDIL